MDRVKKGNPCEVFEIFFYTVQQISKSLFIAINFFLHHDLRAGGGESPFPRSCNQFVEVASLAGGKREVGRPRLLGSPVG